MVFLLLPPPPPLLLLLLLLLLSVNDVLSGLSRINPQSALQIIPLTRIALRNKPPHVMVRPVGSVG
jgi:hypothetical protein